MPETSARPGTSTGPGRVLITVYAVFAVSASARSGVQLATEFGHAPVAYALSAFSAAVYVVATLALARDWWKTALAACTVELLGVLAIGTLGLALPAAFPDQTVWSGYGRGYGYVPLVLPVLGLLWLRRTRHSA